MKFIIYLLLLLLFVISDNVQAKNFASFSFDRNPKNDILWGRLTTGGSISSDNDAFVEGKASWCLTSNYFGDNFNTFIYKYFSFTEVVRTIKLSIWSKSIIIDNAWIKVWCFDKNEELIKKDSLSIKSDGLWKNFVIEIEAPKTGKLYIEIEAKSKDTLNNKSQKLWIDNLQIKTNSTPHNLSSTIIKSKNKNFRNSKFINLSSLEEFHLIKDFKNPKIIAFGESVHGSDEIQNCTFEAIKNLIIYENCKLVLLELPFELGLRLNDFTLGETSEDLESLMALYNFNLARFWDFLDWIRRYNGKTSDKVIVSGMDNNISNILCNNHLLSFIQNQKIELNSLNILCKMINDEHYMEALEFLHKVNVSKKISNQKLEAIIHAINLRCSKYNPTPSLLEGDRDYIQFQNAKFAIDTWSKNTTKLAIYAHLGHLNKKNDFGNRIYIPSLGNYMKKYYNRDYFVIAIVVGEGFILNTDSIGNIKGLPLSLPCNNSLEKLCLKSKYQTFYRKLEGINSIAFIRYIGSLYIDNQFYPFSNVNRCDATICIKHSNAYAFPSSWPKTKREYIEFVTKIRNQNEQLENK